MLRPALHLVEVAGVFDRFKFSMGDHKKSLDPTGVINKDKSRER